MLISFSSVLQAQVATQFKAQYLLWQSDDTLSTNHAVAKAQAYALEIGPDRSVFYHEAKRLYDSIFNDSYKLDKNFSLAYSKASKAISSPHYAYFVRSDFATAQCQVMYHIDMGGYIAYRETLEKPSWQLYPEEQKSIAGYTCQKARCRFLGKEWTAWFTPDIPYPYGPWKLSGLPGLILEAKDAEGHYHMLLQAFERMEPTHSYLNEELYGEQLVPSREGTKKEIEELFKLYMSDPQAYIQFIHGPGTEIRTVDGQLVEKRNFQHIEY